MDIPYSWLGAWIPDLPPPERLAEDLHGLGYEVAEVRQLQAGLAPVVLAEVAGRRPHPDSDHLALVTVRTGPGHFATVVTGAANGHPGDKVWYGPPGTVLPDGRTLETVEFRGVPSPGMLLSAEELGYQARDGEDLWIWRGPEPDGTNWSQIMGDETVFSLELTPNLAQHAQSAIGVARDLAALYARIPPELPAAPDAAPDARRVRVEAWDRCPIYWLGEFEVQAGAMPLDRQRCLQGAGFRLISPVVDATNYVLMDLGQPLHAFDADRVRLPIVVRLARQGEQLVLLDGRTVDLEPDDLVIADQDGPVALAGVMGGQRAQVTPATRRVLVESAHFTPPGIYRTARRLDLMTDAALRFSRGTDPAAAGPALGRMQALLQEAGALDKSGATVLSGNSPRARELPWDPERLRRWLGTDWGDHEMAAVLGRLGFRVSEDGIVSVPSFRPDIDNAQDLAEEVARVWGMDAIPVRVPVRAGVARPDPEMRQTDRVRDVVAAAGYMEVLPRSLIAPGLLTSLGLEEGGHRIVNPLREEESVLQPSVLPGLLLTARYNRDREVDRLAFFTVAPVFLGTPEKPREEMELGVFLSFGREEDLHGSLERNVYDLKGLVEHVAAVLGWDIHLEVGQHPGFLHPGRSLVVTRRGRQLGSLGELHPTVLETWRLGPAGVLLLRLPPVSVAGPDPRTIRRPSRFPGVRRDLSLVIPRGTVYREVVAVIEQEAGPWLQEVAAYDRFVGAFGESLTLRLRFQADDRTLTEAEVDEAVTAVLVGLERLGVERRG